MSGTHDRRQERRAQLACHYISEHPKLARRNRDLDRGGTQHRPAGRNFRALGQVPDAIDRLIAAYSPQCSYFI